MTRPTRTVIVFARAPRFGAVKTRLARDIGRLEAWTFYRRALAALVRRLTKNGRWTVWLAVTPDSFARAPFRGLPKGVRCIPQGRGDLGRRMARALRAVPSGPAVLIGADIPGVRAGHITQAFAKLADHDAVFGPAADGGYWLVGFRRAPAANIFDGVRWSTPHALADTLANLEGLKVAPPVETLADVDDGRAWRALTSGVP